VALGALSNSVLGSGSRWLEVTVGSETLVPRLEILSVAYAVTAASAESVGGYSVSATGNNIIPVTDGSGRLNVSVIPASGLNVSHASSADFSTLSGTATSAADATHATDADTAGGYEATTEADADKILVLDSNTTLKGMAVSAEAGGAGIHALFVNNSNNGKIGIKTSGAGTSGDPHVGAVGTGVIPNTQDHVDVYNNSLTANSIILLSVGHPDDLAANIGNLAVKVFAINLSGSKYFTVKAIDESTVNYPAGLPFCYLIIN